MADRALRVLGVAVSFALDRPHMVRLAQSSPADMSGYPGGARHVGELVSGTKAQSVDKWHNTTLMLRMLLADQDHARTRLLKKGSRNEDFRRVCRNRLWTIRKSINKMLDEITMRKIEGRWP